jgi:hypothetical protein
MPSALVFILLDPGQLAGLFALPLPLELCLIVRFAAQLEQRAGLECPLSP